MDGQHCGVEAPPEPTQTGGGPHLEIALAGNPNTGKTSLFNSLTGARARVGNYPGVTVERRTGSMVGESQRWRVHDLPGCYSLQANAPDEEVARGALSGRFDPPAFDAVIVLLDAAQLGRNLLLLMQVSDMGVPVVAALNLVADAAKAGITVDCEGLGAALGCAVVPLEAPSGAGVPALITAVERAAAGQVATKASEPPQDDVSRRQRTEQHYAQIDALVGAHVRQNQAAGRSWSERIDQVALHGFWGSALFVVALGLLFQAVFAWAEPAINAVDAVGMALATFIEAHMAAGLLRGALVDGVLAGVAGTAVFLPQIAILFLGIEVLEDSGYLARSAYLVDRLMRAAGLPGRSFVPLLSSFACNVPGIMATRTIPARSERLVTILVAPLMPCAARLPVYTMVTAAVFAGSAPLLGIFSLGGVVITAMYMLGISVALVAALILRRSVLTGDGQPMLLELPPYRWPRPRNVLRRVWDRAWLFITGTGSVIVALTIVLWALMTFPHGGLTDAEKSELQARAEVLTRAGSPERERAAAIIAHRDEQLQLERSIAGRMGKAIEPVIAPLGFDWRIGIGLIGSFAAREVLIPVMGQVYGRGKDDSDESALSVGRSLVSVSGMTPLVGISLMVFFAIAMQCLSTVAVIRTETGSWRWAAFALLYLNALAWLLSAAVFQVGSRMGYT